MASRRHSTERFKTIANDGTMGPRAKKRCISVYYQVPRSVVCKDNISVFVVNVMKSFYDLR